MLPMRARDLHEIRLLLQRLALFDSHLLIEVEIGRCSSD